jgi:hypothetical protein
MSVIRVPKPQGKFDPSRPVSSLLSTQIQHLHEAEKNLPPRYHSEHYIKAIRTEGEAAEYIRDVTEAIYRAHADAKAGRARRARSGISLAAAAEEKPTAKRAGGTKAKQNKTRGRTKPQR